MRNVMQRMKMMLAALAVMLTLAPHVHAEPAKVAEIDPADIALAERLADLARYTVSGRSLTPANFKMAGALLEAANKLNPTEPRFPRLWNDAMLRAQDSAGAMRALKAYMAIDGEDRPALIQYTDLQVAAFETVDQRLDYLTGWADDSRLPEEVRSHIAYLAFAAYTERAETAPAKAMLDKSLRLNPLNLEALRARYDHLGDGTPFERLSTLLAMLRSNPNQINTAGRVAQELANVGMAQQSLQFFGLSFNLAKAQNVGVPREPALAYAVELAEVNQLAAAKQLLDGLIGTASSDYELLVLRLLVERVLDQKDAVAKSSQQVQTVLFNRLQDIRRTIGDKNATTRPVDSGIPVVWGAFGSDIRQLKEMKEAQAKDLLADFEGTLVEIAWFELYFRESPADAKPVLDAIRQLVPENSPLLARLDGWSFLARHDKDSADAAKVKLSAVKQNDPLAELGLIKLMDEATSKQEGEKLLARHPTGILAMLILDALRDRKVTLVPSPDVAEPINELLGKFPTDWLSILDQPQRFYTLSLDPIRVAHSFGEPMLMKVSIKNISDYPITIGAEGILRQDLWLDAQIRGVAQQNLFGSGYDSLGHEVVLQPHAIVSQVVRVDQGSLAQALTANPFPGMQVVMQVRTNPSASAATGVGPAGQRAQASKFIERNQFAFTGDSIVKLQQSLQAGGPAEKIRNIDLATAVALILSQQQSSDDAKRVIAQLLERMQNLTRDPSPSVQAWASATLARILGPVERATVVNRMADDPQWATRLLAMTSMSSLKIEEQRAILKRLSKDTDPVVLNFGNALNELFITATTNPAVIPTTNPAAPSTAPETGPAKTPGDSPFGSTFSPLEIGPGGAPPVTGPTSKPSGGKMSTPSAPRPAK